MLRERKRKGQATSFCGYDPKVVHIVSSSVESGHMITSSCRENWEWGYWLSGYMPHSKSTTMKVGGGHRKQLEVPATSIISKNQELVSRLKSIMVTTEKRLWSSLYSPYEYMLFYFFGVHFTDIHLSMQPTLSSPGNNMALETIEGLQALQFGNLYLEICISPLSLSLGKPFFSEFVPLSPLLNPSNFSLYTLIS